MMIHFQSSAWCLCCPAHHVDWTAPTTPQGSNIFSHSSDRGWLRARYNSSVYFQARYSSWVYTTFGETNFIQYLVPTTPNFGGNGPESLSWADAMLSLALFFEQVLAMHIHNSWFQQLRILWVWTIELSWADTMLHLSCVRTSLGYESACRLSASEIQEQQSRSCPLYVPKTLHLRQVFHNRRSRCSVSKYTEWKHEKRIQQLARLPNSWGMIFGRDATVYTYNRWVRQLRA